MKTTAEIVKELEEAKKQLAALETQNYALSATVNDLRTSLEAQKNSIRVAELKIANEQLKDITLQLNSLKDWLDHNYKFIDVKEGEVRIATPHKRVWYFPSDRTDLYPMSNVPGKAA